VAAAPVLDDARAGRTAAMGSYEETYRRSMDDPEAFWGEAAAAVDWDEPWERVLDDSNPPFVRWFAGGRLNTCHNAVDRHVAAGRGDQVALIHDSAMTGTVRRLTYRELRDQVARFAGALSDRGVGVGDRVLIYMPMVPEAVVAMLACARIGAIHSVVFGGFAARELAARIDDAEPKVIVTASCGLEPARVVAYQPLLRQALELSGAETLPTILLQRPELEVELGEHEVDWHDAVARTQPVDCVPVAATDPLYILYTSGTTGRPKGVVRDNGGHAVALAWSMQHIYGVDPGDVYWAASDIGWVVGHSYIVYGPLLHGCTTVMYEGKPVGTPDAGAFWRVVADHGVSTLFTAPTAFRAIKREDPDGEHLDAHDISSLRALFLAGERCDPDTLEWARDHLGIPVVDHWWQTETGWPIAANPLGIEELDVPAGAAGRPVPGWDVRILRPEGDPAEPGETGEVVIRLPLPPGALPTLWGDDDRFVSEYLRPVPGHYRTGDAGVFSPDGDLSILSRIDDIINVAGHRLSTGTMEEVLAAHPDVAEAAVIGVPDPVKGEVPMGIVVLNKHLAGTPDSIRAELIEAVREEIGPVASFKLTVVVERLPKTRSGKVLRRTMRMMAEGREYDTPSTIEDPAVLPEVDAAIRTTRPPR
jgi:propionyl-CoA synthetase